MPQRYLLAAFAVLGLPLLISGGENNVASLKDWPQWRGPKRDAVSIEKGLLAQWPEDGPKLIWNSRDVNKGKGVRTSDGKTFRHVVRTSCWLSRSDGT